MTGSGPIPESVLAAAPIPAIVVDADEVVQQYNAAAAELFGWERTEIVGEPLLVRPTDERRDDDADLHERVVVDGELVRIEGERLTSDGDRVPVEIATAPIEPGGGGDGNTTEPGGRIAYYRRLDEDAGLPSDGETLAYALRAFPDFVFLYDEDGEYLDAAIGWEGEYTMYERTELIGMTVYDVFDADTADDIVAAIRRSLDGNRLEEVTYALETPDGPVWYEGQITPLPDDVEPPVEGVDPERTAVLCARDVTERREYRQRLEAKNEQLEQFASVVSHDIRNPLSVVKGHVNEVRERSDDATPHLDLAAQAADQMETLVDDILALAQQGQRIDETEPERLAEIVDDAWTFDEGTLVVADDLGVVETDADRLRQLFANLFGNAVDHAGPDVTVRVGTLDEAEGFYVADDGPGIPPSKRDQVFDTGYTTSSDGTGFGLPIVEEVATAHGWRVTVSDSRDGGARFEITGVSFE